MTHNSCVTLVATSVKYRSANDERSFFEWIERIHGVEGVKGIGRELHVEVRTDIDEIDLRDIIALFFRYGVDLTQIPRAFSVEKYPWLVKEGMYWFSAMFPE